MEPLVSDYVSALRAEGRPRSTITSIDGTLRRANRATELPYGIATATTGELRAWLGREHLGANTRAAYHHRLRGFYEWCVRERLLDWNPMETMKAPRGKRCLPKPCADGDLVLIVTQATEPMRTLAIFAAWAGLRCCELARIRAEDVTERAVLVRSGKGDRDRMVRCHPMVWQAVADLPPGVIVTTLGGTADPRWVSNTGVRHCVRLGLPGVSLHRLRHWYGTRLLDSGASTLHVQQALGHASVTSTQGYALVSEESLSAAILDLPGIGQLAAAP